MSFQHEHEWSEWQETNKHSWSHAKTAYRWCKKCPKDEYRLIELLCPQYKMKKVYCSWCEPYALEWKKRLKNMEFEGILDQKIDLSYNEFMKHLKRGKPPETMIDRNKELYKFILEGHTFAEASEKFEISRPRAYELYKKFDKKVQKVA